MINWACGSREGTSTAYCTLVIIFARTLFCFIFRTLTSSTWRQVKTVHTEQYRRSGPRRSWKYRALEACVMHIIQIITCEYGWKVFFILKNKHIALKTLMITSSIGYILWVDYVQEKWNENTEENCQALKIFEQNIVSQEVLFSDGISILYARNFCIPMSVAMENYPIFHCVNLFFLFSFSIDLKFHSSIYPWVFALRAEIRKLTLSIAIQCFCGLIQFSCDLCLDLMNCKLESKYEIIFDWVSMARK